MKMDNGTYLRPQRRFHWWLTRTNYFQYMMRELSSLFIAAFTLTLIWGIWRFSEGPSAYLLWLSNLWDNLLWFSVSCFLFATYHSITWFWVTPKAMPMTFNGKAISDTVIIAAHLFAWILISLIIWLIIQGGV